MENKLENKFTNPFTKQETSSQTGEQKQEDSLSGVASIKTASDQNNANIYLTIFGIGAGVCAYYSWLDNQKLRKELGKSKSLRKDFKSFRKKTRSEINDLKDETTDKPKKQIEDYLDVEDVEGYEIRTDEQPEAEKKAIPSSAIKKNIFLA